LERAHKMPLNASFGLSMYAVVFTMLTITHSNKQQLFIHYSPTTHCQTYRAITNPLQFIYMS
jgi:hypothetical protein